MLNDVRATDIPGVGIKWSNHSSTTNTTGIVTRRSLNDAVWNRGILQIGVSTFTDTFELIKTSHTPATGNIPTFALNMEYSTPVSNNVKRLPLYKYIFTPINTSTVSCQVSDRNLNVNMGIATIPKFNGVGSTLNPVDFFVALNCDENTAVNITIDNVSPITDPVNGVLGLNSDSTANGVGVQLLYNNTPVQFGKMIKFDTILTAGKIVNIPFRASYYQTETNIESGTANATASFTMTYQ
ncbi:fimbrial protein [Type-E symbiont of Plautia stali]|uniref:fimbrial protein n=1 Tax=Type-E symbiont of Plautia stali TaxID=1560357 RepID=UPI002570A1E5|nr:fimbrial protein [Type-E symbiont of Plautia stali]